jgi:hypothetical protein
MLFDDSALTFSVALLNAVLLSLDSARTFFLKLSNRILSLRLPSNVYLALHECSADAENDL